MREPPQHPVDQDRDAGITPACAGTTAEHLTDAGECWDHPRVCGNHMTAYKLAVIEPGSPPRVREPHETVAPFAVAVGITPACAGTTS